MILIYLDIKKKSYLYTLVKIKLTMVEHKKTFKKKMGIMSLDSICMALQIKSFLTNFLLPGDPCTIMEKRISFPVKGFVGRRNHV